MIQLNLINAYLKDHLPACKIAVQLNENYARNIVEWDQKKKLTRINLHI